MTSRVAVAAAAVIPVATVTITTTKAPWSDGRRSRNGEIAMPKVPEAQKYRVVVCERSRVIDRHWHFGMGWVYLLFIVFLFYWLKQMKMIYVYRI